MLPRAVARPSRCFDLYSFAVRAQGEAHTRRRCVPTRFERDVCSDVLFVRLCVSCWLVCSCVGASYALFRAKKKSPLAGQTNGPTDERSNRRTGGPRSNVAFGRASANLHHVITGTRVLFRAGGDLARLVLGGPTARVQIPLYVSVWSRVRARLRHPKFVSIFRWFSG
jgi:hypothetical protein